MTTERGFKIQAKKTTFKNGVQMSENFFEINKHPERIIERFPLAAGNTVLHLSKKILLDFVRFLNKNLEKNSFKFIYTGEQIFQLKMLTSTLDNQKFI